MSWVYAKVEPYISEFVYDTCGCFLVSGELSMKSNDRNTSTIRFILALTTTQQHRVPPIVIVRKCTVLYHVLYNNYHYYYIDFVALLVDLMDNLFYLVFKQRRTRYQRHQWYSLHQQPNSYVQDSVRNPWYQTTSKTNNQKSKSEWYYSIWYIIYKHEMLLFYFIIIVGWTGSFSPKLLMDPV